MTNVEREKGNKVDKKRVKVDKQLTKVVVRHLPPSMTLESFLEQVDVPPHDYICFGTADKTLMPHCTSRVYINFLNIEDLLIFTEKFDGYVFLDNKGHEYQAVVEFAPFQRIAKTKTSSYKKKNTKCGSIESDPYFIEFKKNLLEEREKAGSCSFNQHYFETNTDNGEKNKITDTPLLQYLRNKHADKAKSRDEKREERKRKDAERKKIREEQQNLRRTQASSNIVYTGGPYGNKRKQDERSKPGRDRDAPAKNQTSKTKLSNKGVGAQNEKPINSQDSKDDKKIQMTKEETLIGAVAPFHDPAIIEVRLASGNVKPKSRYNRQDSNSQQERKQRHKEENKKSKSTDAKLNRNKDKSNYRESVNKDKGDRFLKNKQPQEGNPRDKSKQGEENKSNEDKTTSKNSDSTKENHSVSVCKTKSLSNIRSIGEKKIVPKNAENLIDNRKTVKSNKGTDNVDSRTPVKSNKETNKIDPKATAKSNNVTDKVDAKESNASSKMRDKVDKSNKTVEKSPDKPSHKSSPKATEKLNSETEKIDPSSHCSLKNETGEHNVVKLELSHNVLQRRKSLEGKQPEKYVESGRRNSLDSGKKNDDEDGRDPRPERRIRNKDRPSIAIYRPGMGRFSKQRISNDKAPSSTEQSHSASPTNMSQV